MGLFSNNKKPCPVCGGATPRLLPTKVEGQALCSDCADKVAFMAESKKKALTLSSLDAYMSFYNEDEANRTNFHKDFEKVLAGLFNNKEVACDFTNRRFKLNSLKDAFTFPADSFVRLEVKQDDNLVLELTKDALKIYDTHVEEKIEALRPEVEKYNNMSEILDVVKGVDYEKKFERDSEFERNRPDFRCKEPFKKWYMTIEVNHPWGEGYKFNDAQIFFDSRHPSIAKALDTYNTELVSFKEMAMALRKISFPDCQIVDETRQAAPGTKATTDANSGQAPSGSSADELMKFKGLLDAGVITQDEFEAKKRQLLGL